MTRAEKEDRRPWTLYKHNAIMERVARKKEKLLGRGRGPGN